MPSKRHHVIDVRGIARRSPASPSGESIMTTSTIERLVTIGTIRNHIRDMRQWSDNRYVNDVTWDDGTRVVSARRHVAGVENVRILRIAP